MAQIYSANSAKIIQKYNQASMAVVCSAQELDKQRNKYPCESVNSPVPCHVHIPHGHSYCCQHCVQPGLRGCHGRPVDRSHDSALCTPLTLAEMKQTHNTHRRVRSTHILE